MHGLSLLENSYAMVYKNKVMYNAYTNIHNKQDALKANNCNLQVSLPKEWYS